MMLFKISRAFAEDTDGSIPFPVIVMIVALLGLGATVIGGVTIGVETSTVAVTR